MKKNRDKVEFYRELAYGEDVPLSDLHWRWQRVASNGKIVGASTEGYQKLSACRANYYRQFIQPSVIITRK
jgi:hypothetical protein